ncbi:MAG: pilus assembly PilX N-terminal domain-containing protein [Deltaproteobacteria bacterium]|jgi:Tfp pilus assembly protein PilX|nr:pilus assembly PilX N-terminal domain-containing protein [Deltaproteobacteria bacterium]
MSDNILEQELKKAGSPELRPTRIGREDEGFREGMILVTTLIIMMVITIIGAGVLFTSRVELTTTNTYRQNFSAFNYADAFAHLGIRAADAIASGTKEDVMDHLKYKLSDLFDIEVTDKIDDLNADESSSRFSVKNRYLNLGNNSSTLQPDLIIKDKVSRKVIGAIMISHDLVKAASGGFQVGSSMAIADKANTGVGNVSLQYYVITASGRDPNATGVETFFSKDDELGFSGPQSFITVLYSVVKGG